MSFEKIDLTRLQVAREEAFGGKCSINVINTAGLAEDLLKDIKPVDGLLTYEFNTEIDYYPNLNEQTFEKKDSYRIRPFLNKHVDDEDSWIRFGIKQVDSDKEIILATLKLKDPKHKCAVVLFEPTQQSEQDWADNIITTVDDEESVIKLENGDYRYNLKSVVSLYNLIKKDDTETLLKFIKELGIKPLFESTFNKPSNSDEEIDNKLINPDKLEFIKEIMLAKLAKLAVKESVTLFEQKGVIDETTRGMASKFIIQCILSKNESGDAKISWPIHFGESLDTSLATSNYHPDILLSNLNSDYQFIDLKGDIIEQPNEAIDELGENLGYREITSLPKPNKLAKLETIGKGNFFKFYESFEENMQNLANHIAWCADKGKVEELNDAVKQFQDMYADRLDLLDLGTIKMYKKADQDFLLLNIGNIKATIDAPNHEVLRNSFNCSGVYILSSKNAFVESQNIQFSKVENSITAFSNARNIRNCTTNNVEYAFSSAFFVDNSTSIDCKYAFVYTQNSFNQYKYHAQIENKPPFSNCEAINTKKAFYITTVGKTTNAELYSKIKREMVKKSVNNRWVSQPGLLTKKPHKVVNSKK